MAIESQSMKSNKGEGSIYLDSFAISQDPRVTLPHSLQFVEECCGGIRPHPPRVAPIDHAVPVVTASKPFPTSTEW